MSYPAQGTHADPPERHIMRPLPLTAAAVLSAAALAVPVAPALAAGHGHGHANTHAGHAKTHDHLAQQERGASHALANQLRQVNRIADRAATSERVSDVDRDGVSAELQADSDALTALADQLAAATTHHDVVAAVHQGVLVRAVARTQFTVAAQAGHVRSEADALTTAAQDLQTQVDAATAAGQDTTAATAALTDLATQVTTASADADAAIAAVVALGPDSTRPQVNDARDTAEAALADAETALEAATLDQSTVETAVAGFTAPTP